MFCPNCGNKSTGEEDFCSNCGTNLKEIEQVSIEANNNLQNIDENIVQKKIISDKKIFSKKNIIILGCLIIAIIISVLIVINLTGKKTSKEDNKLYSGQSGEEVLTTILADNGIPKFIIGDFAKISVRNEADALKALEKIKDQLKANDVYKEFKLDYSSETDGINYYRFNQLYNGIELYNNNVIISADKDGKVLGFSGYYIPNINIDINEKKTKQELEEIVKKDMGADTKIIESKKYIYADNKNQRLVYVISSYSSKGASEYIVDANDGSIVISSDLFSYAEAYEFTGNGINGKKQTVTLEKFYDINTLRDRYRLVDPKRNILIADGGGIGGDLIGAILGMGSRLVPMVCDIDGTELKYTNNLERNKLLTESAISTLKNYEDVYDYYLNVLGRKSYDNEGAKIVVNIDVRDKTLSKDKYENASWLAFGQQFFIGYLDDISLGIAKDVIAHEFTHAVISKTAKFALSPKEEDKEKAFETGALNEGIADIFGMLIKGDNWTVGEDIRPIRSAISPNDHENPNEKGGQYYYPDSYIADGSINQFLMSKGKVSVYDYDNGGIHNNSTVVSHAAYLMYENGAFKSKEEMAQIWYKAINKMSSYTNFEDCANAVLAAATESGLSLNSLEIIKAAFIETKMLEPETVKVEGKIVSGKEPLKDVEIKIYDSKDKLVYEIKSDKDGQFLQELQTGTYKFVYKKATFEDYSQELIILGDTKLDIKMSHTKSGYCPPNGCCLTMYYLDTVNEKSDELVEKSITEEVECGTKILSSKDMSGWLNKTLGNGMVTDDGETFYIKGLGSLGSFAFYYKDTDTKFNFNTPINGDIEIEMKVMDGLIDNDTILNGAPSLDDIGNIVDKYAK